ncbi:MAG TPA: thiolase family protein [Acidimicrobiales bacterium]|nr:thiolase family protein [Acidimicrobiales bacterium]
MVIVDACRTAIGLRHGGLSGWHPVDLAGAVLTALAGRSGVDPGTVDDVVMGCATPVGDQGCNLARSAVLAAGWPSAVPASTIDSQGASSLRAVAVAAAAIAAGSCEVVVAGGIDLSSTTPAGAWVEPGSRPFGPAVVARYAGEGGLVPPGVAAEAMATRYDLGRDHLDRWAVQSRDRAVRAVEEGRFDDEIVAVPARQWDRERRLAVDLDVDVVADEAVARVIGDTSSWPAMFVPGGVITAANSSPVGDGAAALLLMSEERAAALGMPTLAHVVGAGAAGVDPRDMLGAVIPAAGAVLRRSGVGVADVARFEVDETYATVPLAWMAELGVKPARVNPEGGSIAFGHPPGAGGARMLTSLVHGLARTDGGLGLATSGGVGGVAAAVLVASSSPP